MFKLLPIALLIAGLGGCAQFPSQYDKPLSQFAVKDRLPDGWTSTPAIRYTSSSAGISVRKYGQIPTELAERPLAFDLDGESGVTIEALLATLRKQGYKVVIEVPNRTASSRSASPTLDALGAGDKGSGGQAKSPDWLKFGAGTTNSGTTTPGQPKQDDFWSSRKESASANQSAFESTPGKPGQQPQGTAAKKDGEQQTGAQTAAAIAKTKVLLTSFNGPFGQFIDDLTTAHNLGYEYRNGTVFITDANRYAVTLPQNKELLKHVGAALDSMGATGTREDLIAGQIFYSAKPDAAVYIDEYLRDISQNAGMVTLQVAVLNVRVSRDVNIGFDWAKFAIGAGGGGLAPGAPATTAAGDVADVVKGSLAVMSGNGGSYQLITKNFSLNAAIQALSTYGEATTEQNVTVNTLSGLPVKLASGNTIPYVKSVGAATTSGGSTTGSTETTTVNSGLSLQVTPFFSALDKAIVTAVKVELASLVAFRELKAGNTLGTISQPEMQNMTFDNVGRLAAGDTVVVGGMSYDQVSDNYSSLPGLEDSAAGSKSKKTTRNAFFIVIRPTVVMFSADAAKALENRQDRPAVVTGAVQPVVAAPTPVAAPAAAPAAAEPASKPQVKALVSLAEKVAALKAGTPVSPAASGAK